MSSTYPRLADFRADLDRGRPVWVEVAWRLARFLFIETTFPWPSRAKEIVLRRFGAKIGKRFYIRPGVRIHFPWKLICDDDVWIGEGTMILNLDTVHLKNDTALAHDVFLAAAGHDIRDRAFRYANRPIVLGPGVWVASRAFVGPGVTIEEGSVVLPGAVVTAPVGQYQVVGGVPARPVATRHVREDFRQ
ncbi:putative colanic acid biosynthesis acetyltransferase [Nocardioides marinus]